MFPDRKTNNSSKPVRNDTGRHPEATRAEDVRREPYPFNASVKNPKDLQTLECRFFAFAQNDAKDKNRNELINLSTYRLIDLKNVKNLFPYFPISLSLKKKFAFTLAEVLITLGIIGIVAAMTIPTLIHNYKAKEMRTRLLRANSIIQNGIGRMVADEININDILKNRDTKTIRMYFKDGGCLAPQNRAEGNYHNYDGTRLAGGSAQTIYWPPYCLADGMLLWFATLNDWSDSKHDSWSPTDYTILIVDINGWKNPPDNWGKDTFFWFYNPEDNRVRPFGPSSYIFKSIASTYYYSCPGDSENMAEAGIGCTEQAINDDSYFKKLKY